MKNFKRFIAAGMTVLMLLSALVFTSSAAKTPFSDVKDDYWFANAVAYCYNNKYVTGTSATTFSPSTNLTRAQFVTLLANISGEDVSVFKNVDSGFKDVKNGTWYHNAVTWAANRGYVSGTGEKQFSPNSYVTREQLARIFYVYSDKQGYNVSTRADLSKYTDAGKISSWAKEQVSWAVSRGIINGMSATTIAPRGNATRAQAAQIIMTYTKIDFSKDISRFRVFCSNLDPYIPDDAEYWGVNGAFMHNETLGTNTYTSGNYTYTNTKSVEFSYFTRADVLTFRYRNETKRVEAGQSYANTGYSELYGAVYQGKTEVYMDSSELETYNRYKTKGSFSGDKHVYSLTDFSGYKYTEAQAKAAAESFSAEALGVLDTISKKICGYRFLSVANTAPKYSDLSAMTNVNKLIYSLPIDFEYYYGIASQRLEYRFDHVDNSNNERNDRATVNFAYNLDDDSFNCYYVEDNSIKSGNYVNINTMLSINLDSSPVSLTISHNNGDAYYGGRIYLKTNGTYAYDISSIKNMTEAQVKSHLQEFMNRAVSRCNLSLKEVSGMTLATLCN